MKDSEQMELIPSTSSQEDTPVSLSQSLDDKKLKRIRDISGQSILGLSKNSGQLGSLEKTLVDTLNSVSTPCSRTWRVKVTERGHLVFQLLASAPTTKERESGLWPTPSRGMWKQDVNDDGRYARDIKKKGFQVMLPAAVKIRGKGGGQLNPKWVEWIMGYPRGWTDLNV